MDFYIFGSGEYGECQPVSEDRFIIAADGGLDRLRALGLRPDLAVGDFDSLTGALPEGVPTLRHPVMKDDTDMALAVDEALSRGAGRIIIYGGTGGRLDHTFANLQLLAGLSRSGVEAFLIGPRECVCAVTDGTLRFGSSWQGTLSLFAWDRSVLAWEHGLLYGLDGAALSDSRALGISNEFTGRPARLTVRGGTALVMWTTQADMSLPEFAPGPEN